MHATWSRVGRPPEFWVTGDRKTVKILGAIELWRTRFLYRQDNVFNASTYLAFLELLAQHYRRQGAILIQDNASYHKDDEVLGWFSANRHWLEVHQLPAYSPELNPSQKYLEFLKALAAKCAGCDRPVAAGQPSFKRKGTKPDGFFPLDLFFPSFAWPTSTLS